MTAWTLPALGILEPNTAPAPTISTQEDAVLAALSRAGLDIESVSARLAPQLVRYLVHAAPGTDPKKIERATDAVSLAVGQRARYAGVDGGAVAIEVSHEAPARYLLREAMASCPALIRLGLPLGSTVASGGAVTLTSWLADMPHLLVAGTTGSGKSAFLTSMITALLLRNSPDDMRLTLVDPKRVELAAFAGLPHLSGDIITEASAVGPTLRRLGDVMDQRYELFAQAGVRKIEEYNDLDDVVRLPRMVLVVDEMADLMLTDKGILEKLFVRLLSLGRAAGIHLMLATQRPEAKVFTGLIRSNVPARVVFSTQSHVDSKVALGYTGAEKLRGAGDGLYKAPSVGEPVRFQAPMVSAADVDRVVTHWRRQRPQPVDKPVETMVEHEDPADVAERRALDEWRAGEFAVDEAARSIEPTTILAEAGFSPIVIDALAEVLVDRISAGVAARVNAMILSGPDNGGE